MRPNLADSDAMPADPTATPASDDRRQFPRWTTAGLESALGRVTDLSLSGMRIRKTGQPGLREGDRFRLEVKSGASVTLLPAQLVSIRPHAGEDAGGMVDLGIRFPELSKAQKRSVKRILEASGWPDGGGEIVFRAMPETDPDDAAFEALVDPEAETPTAAPPADSPAPAPVTAGPEVAAVAPVLPVPTLLQPKPVMSDSPPAAPAGGGLRNWSQLTREADAPATHARPPASLPAVGMSGAVPAPPTPVHDQPGLTAEDAAELEGLRSAAEQTAALAEEAARVAEAPASPSEESLKAEWLPSRPGALPSDEEVEKPNQRRNGRLAAQDAHTALGQVLDISASGMRIRRRGTRPVDVGAVFLLDLYVCGRAVRLPVEVMRIQKAGWRSHDYGLRFGELPPEMKSEFGQLARMAAKHVSIA